MPKSINCIDASWCRLTTYFWGSHTLISIEVIQVALLPSVDEHSPLPHILTSMICHLFLLILAILVGGRWNLRVVLILQIISSATQKSAPVFYAGAIWWFCSLSIPPSPPPLSLTIAAKQNPEVEPHCLERLAHFLSIQAECFLSGLGTSGGFRMAQKMCALVGTMCCLLPT